MITLDIIIASTRPGRVGLPVGQWMYDIANTDSRFETRWTDLAEVNLPFYDEAKHPRFQDYDHPHTKDWAARIDSADAFVIVTPEYNFGMPATLLNAFTFVSVEWRYKPVGFVSYGGVSGGTRAVQMAKQIVTSLGAMPIPQAVNIPFVSKLIEGSDNDRYFNAPDVQRDAAVVMLNELEKWATALKPLRVNAPVPNAG